MVWNFDIFILCMLKHKFTKGIFGTARCILRLQCRVALDNFGISFVNAFQILENKKLSSHLRFTVCGKQEMDFTKFSKFILITTLVKLAWLSFPTNFGCLSTYFS